MECEKNVQQHIVSIFDEHKALHENIIIQNRNKCASGYYI